jgi:hypothetical protein
MGNRLSESTASLHMGQAEAGLAAVRHKKSPKAIVNIQVRIRTSTPSPQLAHAGGKWYSIA